MANQVIKLGEPLILSVQLSEGETNFFPVAVVRDSAGIEVSGSPFDLTHVALGFYKDNSFVAVTEGTFFATYITYEDAGKTVLSDYPLSTEIFNVNVEGISGDEITGSIDEDNEVQGIIED